MFVLESQLKKESIDRGVRIYRSGDGRHSASDASRELVPWVRDVPAVDRASSAPVSRAVGRVARPSFTATMMSRRRSRHRGVVAVGGAARCRGVVAVLVSALALSSGAFASTIKAAEPATIRDVISSNDGSRVTLEATTRGRTFSLTLTRDSPELSANAGAVEWNADGGDVSLPRERIEAMRRCAYEGRAMDDEGTELRAYGTLCHGRLRVVVETLNDPLSIHGDLWGNPQLAEDMRQKAARRMLGVEEIDIAPVSVAESWHLSDELREVRGNATDGVLIDPDAGVVSNGSGDASSNADAGGRKLLQTTTKTVELMIWGAKERMDELANDVDVFIEESMLQVKVMQTIFDKTGFSPRVKLVIKKFLYTGQRSGESADPWGTYANTDVANMMYATHRWSQGNPTVLTANGWDAMLVTTKRTKTFYGAIGYAQVGSVCTKKGINVNAVSKDVIQYAGTLMAHEFGHTLGFMHDGQNYDGTGACDVDRDIMGPTINGPEEVFSQCSIDQYNSGTFREGGTLHNVDHSCLTDPTEFVCGNGIREGDETCDCFGNDCTGKDSHCDAATCRLLPGKTCSQLHDTCCNAAGTGARLASENHVCRPAGDNPCDIDEVCDGTSVSCPADQRKATGEKCLGWEGDVGSCFNGVCENRHKQCSGIGKYYGGKWTTEACAAEVSRSVSGVSPSTFDETDCTEKLWCSDVASTCSIGGRLWFWDSIKTKRDGFPCSTVDSSGKFTKVCYKGQCTALSAVVASEPPSSTPAPTPTPNPAPVPVPPNPTPNPAPTNPVPPIQKDAPDAPTPSNPDGEDVTTNGIVKYVTSSVILTGYESADFNVANRNAFKQGIANYLDLDAGADGVSILSTADARRRRLLSTHRATVKMKILLTNQDNSDTVLSALQSTSSSALQRSLVQTLPALEDVSITERAVTEDDIVANFSPPNEEDVKEYGVALIVGSLAIVFCVPLLIISIGVASGPGTRIGLLVSVLIGEDRYNKLHGACCGAIPPPPPNARVAPPRVKPVEREKPTHGLFGRRN